MNYQGEFRRLAHAVSDCSPELQAFVKQISQAPIWDDDDARRIIGDTTERIDAFLEEIGGWELTHAMRLQMERMQLAALAELRGEAVVLSDSAARRAQLLERILQKQIALPLGVNDTPLFSREVRNG